MVVRPLDTRHYIIIRVPGKIGNDIYFFSSEILLIYRHYIFVSLFTLAFVCFGKSAHTSPDNSLNGHHDHFFLHLPCVDHHLCG